MQSHIEHPGGLSMRNGQNCSHFMFSQKYESHQRSRFHFATPMMVLHRKWVNDLRAEWPNWNTNFARIFAKWLREKAWIFSLVFNWKYPQIYSQHTPNTHDAPFWSLTWKSRSPIWNEKRCMCCSFIAPGLPVHVSISVLSLDTKKTIFNVIRGFVARTQKVRRW